MREMSQNMPGFECRDWEVEIAQMKAESQEKPVSKRRQGVYF